MLDLKPITTTENIKKTQSKKTLTPIKHLK